VSEDFPQREDSLLVERGGRKRGEKQKNAKKRKNLVVDESRRRTPLLSLSLSLARNNKIARVERARTHTHARISLLFERKRQRARKRDRKERKSGLCVITARRRISRIYLIRL
jgi:hypothetical protein